MTCKFQLIAIAPFILLASCSRSAKPSEVQAAGKRPDPVAVTTALAQSRKIEKSIAVTGSLMADESVTISPEISGRIVAIHADFGQNVRKGQVLAELDKTEYQIAVDRSRAALNQALARVGMRPGADMKEPSSSAAIRQAQAQLDDAKFKYESAAKLVKTGDISQERYTEIEKAYRARQAGFENSQDELRTLWINTDALRSEVKLAERRLSDTVLRAPFDGAITQKNLSEGQFVKDNTAILTLVKTWPLRLRVELPESEAGTVRAGTGLAFTTDAAPGVDFHATVRELNPSLDAKNRTLTVEARLAENDRRLRPGMFVQVRMIQDRASEVVMVPRRAIYSIAGLTKVFVIRGGKAQERKIGPGRELDGWMEVPADLVHSGDAVAVSNLATLTDGMDVTAQPGRN